MAIDESKIMARGLVYHDDDKCIHLKCIILTKFCFYKVTSNLQIYQEIQIEIIIFMLRVHTNHICSRIPKLNVVNSIQNMT